MKNIDQRTINNALREGERLAVRARGANVVAIIFETEPAGGGLRRIVAGCASTSLEGAVRAAFANAGRELGVP